MTGPWRLVDGPAGVLRTYAATAPGSPGGPALLLCHELPRVRADAADAGRTYPALADRLSQESGFEVTVGMLRGAGGSDGDFSASGWMEDLAFLVEQLVGADGRIWLVGFGLGGALVLRMAAADHGWPAWPRWRRRPTWRRGWPMGRQSSSVAGAAG